MTQYIRWGVAAVLSAAVLAGCGGSSKSGDPVSAEGQQALQPHVLLNQDVNSVKAHPLHANASMSSRLHPLIKNATSMTERGTLNPFDINQPMPGMSGQISATNDGRATGNMGVFRVEIDENLNAEVIMPRSAQAQGDRFLLGVDQFFQPSDILAKSIRLTPQNALELTIGFSHPFDRPADLIGPPTALKRLDLHIFNVWAGILAEGNEQFFGGAVTTNTSALLNPDSFREVGGLVTGDDGLAANVFPGKWVADQSGANTDPALDNYDETDNGWEASELQDPQGFGVFPQGASVDITFVLDPGTNGGPIATNFVVLADYMDPRGGDTPPEKRANRLPDPIDPTLLRYFLPWAAGDLQAIDATAQQLGEEAASVANVTLRITDLDADAPTTATPGDWPNNANLNEMPFSSDIVGVNTSFPAGVTASAPTEGAGSGNGLPGTPKIWEFTLTNDLPLTAGDYVGLVEVVDEEDANKNNEAYFQLDPNLQPIAGNPLQIRAFQAVPFTVGAATGGDVTISLDEMTSRSQVFVPFGDAPGWHARSADRSGRHERGC